ncbi:MAG: HAMP domain-containing sensor histidine kinase [Pseudomonadota bacterium]
MTRRSLAFRLTVILGGAWFVLFLALGVVIWQTTQRLVQEAQIEKARALATQLATISLDAVLLRDYGTIERYLADLSGAVAYAEIRRADGQVLGRTGEETLGLELLRVPMVTAGEHIGDVFAQYDPNPGRRAAWQLAGLMALSLAVFAGLTFWALRRLLLRRLVAPVVALIEQADPERTTMAVPANVPTEVADLAAAIAGLRERISRHIAEADEAAQVRNEALRRLCSEQRLAAVGQLAGEVAHELNTPLSNILGYAQSALPGTSDPELRESLTTIETQARRAGQIVRDMLTAARAPAPTLQDINLEAICAAFTRLVTPLARKQGVAILHEASGPVRVRGDASRVEQILFNLVFNAVQAGAHEVRLVPSAEPTPGLSVADDGPGLPESVRARLFEPFVTTKPAGQGTGLGLAISQRLAREMGAELALAESAQGTRFHLGFPPFAKESAA